MSETHRAVTIMPSQDLDAGQALYERLGFEVTSDHGHYRILADSRGWHLHLNRVTDWPANPEANPLGLYLYVEDVDAVAERVRELIIEPGTPHLKPWGPTNSPSAIRRARWSGSGGLWNSHDGG